ncbi:MAG TPA: UDP-4-amino-4,6-dideoxy-N-acetyl-beta-L-altrosamine transaminase [Chthoniobacter sp.]|jgi:perosamine synthetase
MANPAESPVRTTLLPYGKQWVDDDDIAAVVEVLRSDWLTTGPKIEEFERAFAGFTGVAHAVAVTNGTAALHAAMAALEIGPGDEVIVPAITFVATSNSVVYQGGTPVFADVEPETLLIDPESVRRRITPRTRAIAAVDYAGQPCNYEALRAICGEHGLALVADACHALGGAFGKNPVGSLADLSTFSLHPVKPLTTGEGGMITTNDPELAARMRVFRNHGITTDFREREKRGAFYYEMTALGYNLRLTDIQCALGLSQLRKLPLWLRRRQEIAARYDRAFAGHPCVQSLKTREGVSHGYHLYVVRLASHLDRAAILRRLRAEGIGANVHYLPVHLHPFYRENFGGTEGQCPAAEAAYQQIVSLPIFPRMSDGDIDDVIAAVTKVTA